MIYIIPVSINGHIKEQTVKEDFFQNCLLLCINESLSGRSCTFYIVKPLKKNNKARCQFGELRKIDNYEFVKKKKTKRDKIMIRVLASETFGTFNIY